MTRLAARFSVGRRFYRAVHLESDATRANACEGYLLTPVGQATLARMLDALAPGGTARAWTLTGPYGVGKSSFVVFLTQLLARPRDHARGLLAAATSNPDPLGHRCARARPEGRAYRPVLVTATFGALVASLLDALRPTLDALQGPRAEALRASYAAVLLARGAQSVHRPLVALIEALAVAVCAEGGAGLLLVIDELGKTLEHAARSDGPADDVYLLQELAELAARSEAAPVMLVTLLHQSVERYARGLGAETRAEWAKVQGRFQDVAFLDAPEEILRLAARSIVRDPSAPPSAFAAYATRAHEAVALGLAAPEDEARLVALAPLHPVVALLLPGLFRGPLVQNERSLFDFLTSESPGSFGAFVATADASASPAYTLDALYDYLSATLGSALYAGTDGRRWAAVDDALARLAHPVPQAQVSLLKAIGLLSILGSRAVRASRAVLRYALAVTDAEADAIDQGLDALLAASFVVYRRHLDAFVLWEGSDVDLDACFEEARRSAPGLEGLSAQLAARLVLRPRVARRHFIETGTLRHFEVNLVAADAAQGAFDAPGEGADGRVVYLLPTGALSQRDLVTQATRATAPHVVIGVPRDPEALLQGARDWWAWEAVRQRGGDLQGDPVARRELAARLRVASAELDSAIHACFGEHAGDAVVWVRAGVEQAWRGARSVAWGLSTACDEAYPDGPRLRNELLNRRVLSSAAAAARRELINRMCAASDQPRLGIVGAPPEWSMYASLLGAGGLHAQRGDAWALGPPPEADPLRLLPTWRAIEAFLSETEGAPRPLPDLYARLAARPIGLRAGPAPVMLFAVMMATPGEVALFEDGTFVAELSDAVVERLLRRPAHFAVTRYRLAGGRAAAMVALSAVLGAERARPTDVMRALVRRINGLTRHARSTRHLGPVALAARDTIQSARDPLRLLFDDLPKALGLGPLDADAPEAMGAAYAAELGTALEAMGAAYPQLLATIEARIADAFGLSLHGEALQVELAERASRMLRVATDLRLRAFLGRAAALSTGHVPWLEGVAMVVGNRPPAEWSDGELARFTLGLEELAAMMRRAESLLAPEAVAPEDVPLVDDATREILRVLEARLGARPEVWRAALGHTLHRLRESAPGDGAVTEERPG